MWHRKYGIVLLMVPTTDAKHAQRRDTGVADGLRKLFCRRSVSMNGSRVGHPVQYGIVTNSNPFAQLGNTGRLHPSFFLLFRPIEILRTTQVQVQFLTRRY